MYGNELKTARRQMALFGLFKDVEKKESKTGSLLMQGAEPIWMARNTAAFADEGYRKNVVAYQAINKVAEAVGSIEWTVWKGDSEIAAHKIIDLLKRPNPVQSGSEYFRNLTAYLMIAGNSYPERVIAGRDIEELYVVRPDRMKVIPSKTGMPSGFQYTVGQKKTTWPADEKTGFSDIRHLKTFNPLDDWYGLSPIEAGAYAVDQHNEAMKWSQALLQNSARPSGALVMGGDKSLSNDQFAELKKEVEEQYSGSQNAGRPMLLEGGLDWKQMGLSPTDMGIIESKNSSARDISLAFGVPPQMLGIPGDSTYANYKEARLAFYEDTVLPLVDYIGSEMSAFFAQVYDGISIKPDLDKISAIAEKRLSLWDMANASDDLTVNERRELKGYPPIEGGDVREMRKTQEPQAKSLDADLLKALAYGGD